MGENIERGGSVPDPIKLEGGTLAKSKNNQQQVFAGGHPPNY
jgi:hypothetical protein